MIRLPTQRVAVEKYGDLMRRWRKNKGSTKALNNCKVIKKRGTIDPLDTSLTEKKLKNKRVH
jgi:hypothetical protein